MASLLTPPRRKKRKNENPNRRHAGDPNPEIECECGCGGRFPKFGESGRPRKVLPGHRAASAPSSQGLVLAALASGHVTPRALAEHLKLSPNAVSLALMRLKGSGQAHQIGRGQWATGAAPEVAAEPAA